MGVWPDGVQEAMDDVYWDRINRSGQYYDLFKLGAFGANLACLSACFMSIWDRPACGLRDDFKAEVLSTAGFALRAVGRLREAAQPMKASLELFGKAKNWKEASINANNLSELQLMLGDLQQGLQHAEKAVAFADRSGDGFMQMACRTSHADASFQLKQLAEAEALFIEAEKRQLKYNPNYPTLYSIPGYRYCNLLITQGRYEAVVERAETTIIIAERNNWPQDIALDNLTLGRALMLRALEKGTAAPQSESVRMEPGQQTCLSTAQQHLNSAVQGFREAGTQHNLPWGPTRPHSPLPPHPTVRQSLGRSG